MKKPSTFLRNQIKNFTHELMLFYFPATMPFALKRRFPKEMSLSCSLAYN